MRRAPGDEPRGGRTGGPPARERRLDLADPRELAAIDDLELVARGVVEGFLIGLHRSPFRGFSVEFAENRPYNPGDDVRFVDWKVYARSDRLFVKQYEEETNLRAWLLLDVSRSMDWSSDPGLPTKLRYARILSASLALLLLRQGDAPGVLAFDDGVRRRHPPRASRRPWAGLLGALSQEPGGGTDAAAVLDELALRLRRRGLVVLVSDLLLDPDPTREALRHLRHQGHEVILFHLLDPGERELPAAGEAVFFDPETGLEVEANSAALRRRYREAVDRALAEWREAAISMGAEHVPLGTDAALGPALRAFFRARRRRR